MKPQNAMDRMRTMPVPQLMLAMGIPMIRECERLSVNTNFLCLESEKKEKTKQYRYALDS